MIAPSSYLDYMQLREILYDHMYTRRVLEVEYMAEDDEKIVPVKDFYTRNRKMTLGIGKLLKGTWIPDIETDLKIDKHE